jgi:DNA-binding response OmpR family regulator
VLVVEDETMIAMLVEDMVQDFGSEVVGPAAKIDEALSLARNADLNAAILDIRPPLSDTSGLSWKCVGRSVRWPAPMRWSGSNVSA